MVIKDDAFQNIDYKNMAVPTVAPSKITDIDTDGGLYDYMSDSMDQGILDLSALESFTGISRSRDEMYNLLDLMCEDPRIAAALDIYASDVCEPNDKGQIVWCEGDDDKIVHLVSMILDNLNVDRNSYKWVYSLCKYGDLYLRLYRESDFNIFDKYALRFRKKDSLYEDLNESVNVNVYGQNDKYAEYMEYVKNPAEMFDLTKFGKSYGYVKADLPDTNKRINDTPLNQAYNNNSYKYNFNEDDVNIFEATEYVHASLESGFDRTEESVTLTSDLDSIEFQVKRGQSVLYDAFKIWRELQLLENAVLLNRITKSSVIRIMGVEVGDMENTEVKKLLQRVKMLFEQKSAINKATSFNEYTNPGPMENTVYVPTHEGKGTITPQQVGGDVDVGDLNDVDHWLDKLCSAIGIPKQYLGLTDDNTGFNGGTSLTLISSRYAKTIKHIQTIYVQAITDAVNLILLEHGRKDAINNFTIKMQEPTTQEEKDRKDNLNTSISVIQSIMSLLDPIEDPATKLSIIKSLLAEEINNNDVITIIQDYIKELEENGGMAAEGGEGGDFGGGGDLGGGGDMGDLGMGAADMLSDDEMGESEPMDLGGEEGGEEPAETGTEENFYHGRGSSVLNERDNLPSFADMGLSYTQF